MSTEVVDRHGEPLYETLSERGARGRILDPNRIPARLARATVAAEDRRFFRHPGVDPIAIARAAWHDLAAGRVVEGGSTLTQQTVKLLLGRSERRVAGKLREMLLALRLEARLGKREILALYLSLAPYGSGLSGAEAASREYFGCPAASLTDAQAALLAGLAQRPSALDPRRHLDRALARQRLVLERLREAGALDAAQLARAGSERLVVAPPRRAFLAPHFVQRVLRSLGERAPFRVETTLDAGLQREVVGILERHRERLREHGAANVAVAVLDNRSGEWLAWEGSGGWGEEERGGAIDGVVSPRQPGSALKPFTYALAFEHGLTPASLLPDLPAHFQTAVPGVLYSPRNYDGGFRGPLRARLALAGSENVPAVWALSRVGVPGLLRLLRRAGLTTLARSADHYGLALTMGDAEVRLDELLVAYASFARGGVPVRPSLVRASGDASGRDATGEPGAGERLVSERTAFWVADVLSDAEARAYAFGRGGALDFPFRVAVKTGTSTAYRDNWTVGFTREVGVGVWVGNFDRTALRSSSGVTGAAPIFRDVMLAAQRRVVGLRPDLARSDWLAPPGELSPRAVCALSGMGAGEACPRVETEWLPASSLVPSCTWHRVVRGRSVVAWPAEYRAWAGERGLLASPADRTSPADETTGAAPAPASLRILNPPLGATYLYDPTLRPEYQALVLRAAAPGPPQMLDWRVDGRPVGTAPSDRALDWPLRPGRHVIRVSDGRGAAAEATILVR